MAEGDRRLEGEIGESIDRALLVHICTAMASLVREGSYRSSMAVAHQITRELQNCCYHHHQKTLVWSEMRVEGIT